MKITELIPVVINKTDFRLSKVKFLPEIFGCYVITNYYGDILYIGQTNNLRTRINTHLNDIHKTQNTELGKAFYLYYNVVGKEIHLSKLERGWLNHFELVEGKLPLLNSVRAPV